MKSESEELRETVLRGYISDFVLSMKEEHVTLDIDVQEAAFNICALYFRYAEQILRPTIDSRRIQHYKIIAFTELCVLRIKPCAIEGEDDELKVAEVNARLALFISVSLLLNWNDIDPVKYAKLIEKDDDLRSFLREHKVWMATLDVRYYFPGFSNSQVWKLFHYLVKDRIQQIL